MLTRQKILLRMLKLAGRPVHRIELMKWSFLLRHESSSKGGNSFYDFVPYKFGPFSFVLYQEIEKLGAMSYVNSREDSTWDLNPEMASADFVMNSALEREVRRIVANFSHLSSQDLHHYVYQRHPAFTVNSELKRLAIRPVSKAAVYTTGYEGVSIDGFLNQLITSGIKRLIDIRSNPIARRYGFHKSTLKRLANKLDIEYFHFAELGIQSEIRQLFPVACDRRAMFDEYEAVTLVDKADSVIQVSGLISESPSVLLCFEADPLHCHRSRLANYLSELTDLPVIHIGS